MKDSRIGAYGAIGIACLLILKLTTLAILPPLAVIGALFLAHPLSRMLATALIWRMDYARAEGKAKPLAQTMRAAEFAIGFVTAACAALAIIAAGLLSPAAVLAGALAGAAATLWLARLFARRIRATRATAWAPSSRPAKC